MKKRARLILHAAAVLLALACGAASAAAKTVYVHLLDGDDARGDGSYASPYKSWRVALRHVGSGDTLVAKNGDYRKAGAAAQWGRLSLTLTMEDKLEPGDPRQPVPDPSRPETVGIYRYDPARPLTVRAETPRGVIIDSVRFHLARGIVIDGFDIFPNPYYTDASGKKLNYHRNGVHGDSVYEPEDKFNKVKTNDPPGRHTAAWYDRSLWTSYITLRNSRVHYDCPPAGCTPDYDPLQDDERLYLVKFNQAHHVTIEDNELFDGKNAQRKPAVDLPCVEDAVVRRNLIRNSHRGVVSKGGGRRVLIEANVFVDNSGAAFSGGSTDPDLFIDGRFGHPCSFAHFESYGMTARDNLVVSTRPGERPVEPVAIWAAKDATVVNNTFVGIGERGVLLVRSGNEVDSPARGCGRGVRLTLTEGLTVRDNVCVLSGVVDETMLYQLTGVGAKVVRFHHAGNTFYNWGRSVPVGGVGDPNREPGFSKADPLLAGGGARDGLRLLNGDGADGRELALARQGREGNDEVGTMNEELKAVLLQFLVHRVSFIVLYGDCAGKGRAMVLWTAFGSVFALLLGYSRIPYAAAADGYFFRVFARLHPRKNFPHVSLVVIGALSVACSFFSLGMVIDALITTRILVQFVGQIAALTLLRRREPGAARPYRVWLYPLPNLIALAGWTFIFATTDWPVILFGLGTLALGVLCFFAWSWRTGRWPFAA